MSPELTDLKPTLEPSKATPFSMSTGAKPEAGIVTWCQRPHRSQNFRSTISTDRFSTKDLASLKSLNIAGLTPFGAAAPRGPGAADHRNAVEGVLPRRSSIGSPPAGGDPLLRSAISGSGPPVRSPAE